MLIDASTSTIAPFAASNRMNSGSVRWSEARLFLRGLTTRTEVNSEPSRKRAMSTSCTHVSLMIMSLT